MPFPSRTVVPFVWLVLVFCTSLLPIVAQADIIIDDFDIAGRVFGPSNEPQDYNLYQPGHGPDGAERILTNRYGFEDESGQTLLDSNGTYPSQLYGQVVNIPTWAGFAEWTQLTVSYSVYRQTPGTWDWSEGGVNNAFFFDFAFVRGPGRISGLRVWTYALTFDGEADVFNIPISDEPFTLAVPLSQFHRSGPGPATLEGMTRFAFAFRSSGHPFYPYFANDDWEFALDRVRVGYLVPEPSLPLSVAICILPGLQFLCRARKRSRILPGLNLDVPFRN